MPRSTEQELRQSQLENTSGSPIMANRIKDKNFVTEEYIVGTSGNSIAKPLLSSTLVMPQYHYFKNSWHFNIAHIATD